MAGYATPDKTAADPPSVSRRNRASSNRVSTNKSKKSGGSKRNVSDKKGERELVLAEDGQQYARVIKRLGDGRFEAVCLGDGQTRLAHVRGKLWKRVWISPHDLVLLTLRAYQDQKGDLVHKYTDDEERLLVRAGEVPTAGAGQRREQDPGYERVLQAERDIHGAARVGFLPTDEEVAFGFEEEGDS